MTYAGQGELFELPQVDRRPKRRKRPSQELSVHVNFEKPKPAQPSWLRRWWKMIVAGVFALGTMITITVWEELRHTAVIWVWHYFTTNVLEEKEACSASAISE